jgi:hypothetical protein
VKGLRWTVAIFGIAIVIFAFVLWLLPTSHTTTKATENTTTAVIDSAGRKSTTDVGKTMTTTTPGVGRSDAMLVATLSFGVGLLVVAVLWNRIKELGIGSLLSITLVEASAETPEITFADADADQQYVILDSTLDKLANKVNAISNRGQRLVRVDLQSGDKWPPTILSAFVLLLARRSRVEVIIFSGQRDTESNMYLGAASLARLADRLAYEDPKLFAAYNAAEKKPAELGPTFDTEMNAQDPDRSRETDRVDPRRLDELAGIALIHDRVETKGEQTLSKQQQRAILLFPLSYVPITKCGHLDKVVDKRLLTEKIALSTVGHLIEVDLLLTRRVN